jgi:hypothetical protein
MGQSFIMTLYCTTAAKWNLYHDFVDINVAIASFAVISMIEETVSACVMYIVWILAFLLIVMQCVTKNVLHFNSSSSEGKMYRYWHRIASKLGFGHRESQIKMKLSCQWACHLNLNFVIYWEYLFYLSIPTYLESTEIFFGRCIWCLCKYLLNECDDSNAIQQDSSFFRFEL